MVRLPIGTKVFALLQSEHMVSADDQASYKRNISGSLPQLGKGVGKSEGDHSPLSTAEVKNERNNTSKTQKTSRCAQGVAFSQKR